MTDELEYREPPPSEPGAAKPVQEKADELLDAARKRGRGLLDRQKKAAVDELHSVADIMRDAAGRFEEREETGLADYVQKAADALDRFSSNLRDRDVEDLVRGVEQGVRTRPAITLGATAVAGFVLGRILRAGTQRIAGSGI
jgi:ElaB/YqjD/DUF883 family membrane-anchored ribosome-binding protein